MAESIDEFDEFPAILIRQDFPYQNYLFSYLPLMYLWPYNPAPPKIKLYHRGASLET